MAHVRSLGPHPTERERLELAKRRERLQKRIETWMRKAADFLEEQDADSGDELELDEEWEETDDEGDTNPDPFMDRMGGDFPRLPLPSAMKGPRLAAQSAQAAQELLLRQGQANDALHSIRLLISHKAVLFRTSVRSGRSQKYKSRAWDSVNSVEANVKHHARIYACSRRAMVNLGADQALLSKYQVLKKADLKATTTIMDPAVPRHRNESLAWFWKLESFDMETTDTWLQECEYNPCMLSITV